METPQSPSLSRRSQLKLMRANTAPDLSQVEHVYRSVKRVLVKHRLKFQTTRSHLSESVYIRVYGDLTKDFRVRISCHRPNDNARQKNDIFIDATRYSRVKFDRMVQRYARQHRELIEMIIENPRSR